jgi:DNA-binding Lrp family transcriptional regulator
MLDTERVHLTEWHRGLRETMKQLDQTNIRILSAMWKFGPRNLLEVSRRTGIPFTSLYHRVHKLESKSKHIAILIPPESKLGLMRSVVLVAAKSGAEERVTEALKIPNLWRSVNRCEGAFTHFSVQLIPIQFLRPFRTYIKQLLRSNLITDSKIIFTGQYVPNFPNFEYYNPDLNEWTFPWKRWLIALKRKPTGRLEDPKDYRNIADKSDLLIVKELEQNARKTFADIAPKLGITLQGVKYHYDRRLLPSGIVKYFGFDVWPYPEEVSAYHEILLEFTSALTMNKFYSLIGELFFVLGAAKVLRQSSLLVRSYMLQKQVSSMFSFFSEMTQGGYLRSYSAVRQDFTERTWQTISYELFDETKGWTFDVDKCLSKLSNLSKAHRVRLTN